MSCARCLKFDDSRVYRVVVFVASDFSGSGVAYLLHISAAARSFGNEQNNHKIILIIILDFHLRKLMLGCLESGRRRTNLAAETKSITMMR